MRDDLLHSSALSSKRAMRIAALLAIVITCWYALAGSTTTLFDRDEPRFAQATVEMIESGNWLFPTFDGNLRPDKPILIYWLMSVPVRLFGPSEWAFRFPSALGIGIATFATFIAARRLVSQRAALLAMLILAASPLTMMMGTAATADGWLLCMITAAIAAFICLLDARTMTARISCLVMLSIFTGLAQLTKGPVALAVVGFASLGTILFAWRSLPRHRKLLFPVVAAFAASVGIFLLWALQANAATQGEFAQQGLGKHVLSRVLAPMEGHGGNFFVSLPYYIPVLIAGFFPWIALLPASVHALWRNTNGEKATVQSTLLRKLVIAWCVPTFVVMSLVATKLPHYVLPIWPALAIVVARSVVDVPQQLHAGWLKPGKILLLISGAIGCAGLLIAPFALNLKGLFWGCTAAAIVIAATTGIAAWCIRRNKLSRACITMLAGLLITQAILAFIALPGFERHKLATPIASTIRQQVPADVPVRSVRFGEPTLIFYLWPARVEMTGSVEAIDSFAAERGTMVLVARRDDIEKSALHELIGSDRYRRIGEKWGYNYSSGRHLMLDIITRDLDTTAANVQETGESDGMPRDRSP